MKKKRFLITMILLAMLMGCETTNNMNSSTNNSVDEIKTEGSKNGKIDIDSIKEPWKKNMISMIENYLYNDSNYYSLATTFTIMDIDNSGIPEVVINEEYKHLIIIYNNGNFDTKEIYCPSLYYDREHGVLMYSMAESGCDGKAIFKVNDDALEDEMKFVTEQEEGWSATLRWTINGRAVTEDEYYECLNANFNYDTAISVYDFALPSLTKLENAIAQFEQIELDYTAKEYQVEEWKTLYKEAIDEFLMEQSYNTTSVSNVFYSVHDLDNSGFPEIIVCQDNVHYYVFTYDNNRVTHKEFHCDSLSYDERNGLIITNDTNMGYCNTTYYKVINDKIVFQSKKCSYLENENDYDFESGGEYYDSWSINDESVTQEEYEKYEPYPNMDIVNYFSNPNLITFKYYLTEVIDEF